MEGSCFSITTWIGYTRARALDFDIGLDREALSEALMLDPHGFVATCNSTHFFIVRDGEVWTSSGNYCLAGITRANVIDICRQRGFQKHMTHHMLDEVDRDWLAQLQNCFLIRDPRDVIASYARTRPEVTVSDVGVLQQAEIFEHARRMAGATPLVLDSRDVLEDPRAMLAALCEVLDVPFSEGMLSWPPGPRSSDGVWAMYWYDAVQASRGFSRYVSKAHSLPRTLEPLAEECEPHYRDLYKQRLRP